MRRINVYAYNDEIGKELAGWFDIDTAESIDERVEWDGQNNVSVHVGDHEHQILYHTAGGRWVRHTWSQWQGVDPTYAFVDAPTAQAWLLINHSDEVVERLIGPIEPERGPGRPAIGPAINVRLPGELLAAVDARAATEGTTRADLIRQFVAAQF